MSGTEIVGLVAQLFTVVALILALMQLIGARAAKHRDFENLYVERYWNLMDSFRGDPWAAPSRLKLPKEDRAKIIFYLQLCEDELDLRRNGFISTKTWDLWATGMISQCARPAYADSIRFLPSDELPALRYFLQTRKDPLKMSVIRKWWTGIGFKGPKR
ncbi:hypothetical protein [Paenarthrobacter sp. A20]|uniref:hypothetical protein n=1 Tax=Paenarthrobacter sp. A20 TaxID=2817891 RepID=UPI0020A052E8|nr:hypothetical protein [Paenarthrobacter sp. A20]MCP1412910.1 hypothetical protein [Paenarthrobacter sp. A20]